MGPDRLLLSSPDTGLITRREGASGPLAPTPGDATGEAMMQNHWAYCPDRNGVCAIVIANAEQMQRDAERIAQFGHDLDQVKRERDRLRRERDDLERENASLRRRLREGGR